MMETISLHFPSHSRLLRIARGVVCSAAESVGFSAREVDEICLAVDEACANIMRHCYGGECDEPIELDCCMGDDRLVVRIRDYGPPFDPASVPERDLDEVKPGGLGLHLIRRLMDDVLYEPSAEKGTQLVLTKYLNTTQEARDER